VKGLRDQFFAATAFPPLIRTVAALPEANDITSRSDRICALLPIICCFVAIGIFFELHR
jgi:hypothetical protein